MKLKVVWLPGRSISLSTENFVCYNRNAILACYIGLYIIFFITQIHRVRFVSVNARASRVKPSKNKFWKEVGNKFLKKKNFGKINYKSKIFIIKIHSKIDRCHTIFALLAPWCANFLRINFLVDFHMKVLNFFFFFFHFHHWHVGAM